MAFVTRTKDPHARLDYIWPWGAQGWLPTGDAIVAVTFTVYDALGNPIDPEDDASPVVVDDFSFTPTDATAWLTEGTVNLDYLVVNHITTDEGREDDRTLKVKIRNK